jgi:acyl carrier protein phosphodiesterase
VSPSDQAKLYELVCQAVDNLVRTGVLIGHTPNEVDGMIFTELRRCVQNTPLASVICKQRKKGWKWYSHSAEKEFIVATVKQRLRDTLFLADIDKEPETVEECLDSMAKRVTAFDSLVRSMQQVNRETPAVAAGFIEVHNILHPEGEINDG